MTSQGAGSPHISRCTFGWRFLPKQTLQRLVALLAASFQNRPAAPPGRALPVLLGSMFSLLLCATGAWAQGEGGAHHGGGEANLVVPNLADTSTAAFFGTSGWNLLLVGLVVAALGAAFGLIIVNQLKAMPVHAAMKEVSELIYETCKTYLATQMKFIAQLWALIAVVIVVYFGFGQRYFAEGRGGAVAIIILFSLIGIAGSSAVAWFGIRVNTFANSRTAFASLRGMPYPCYAIPLKAGMSIGMLLISIELIIMLGILLFIPGSYAGPCFIGFAIGESLGAAALRIAGGIFTKIADIGSDLMKIVFGIKEDDARNPGVIADCTGDNAGDSVGPSADGFETYGVTGVALISFILLAVTAATPALTATAKIQLLVWIFVMRIVMVIASAGSYFINEAISRSRYGNATRFNFELPLTTLVWLTSIVSVILTFIVSYAMIGTPENALGGDPTLWWKLSIIISCGTLAGAIIPELVKIFTSTESSHVKEVVTSSREGGASLNILSGMTAGNFSGFWLGLTIIGLMAIAWIVSMQGLGALMTLAPAGTPEADLATVAVDASPIFAFGLVAFGFLGMGPVTIAVDSYGPVTDNAQSVYELSTIEQLPNIEKEIERDFGFVPQFEVAKENLEANDGAGNTFKATAKPVLIGTAVVGAVTLIFSIVVLLTNSFEPARVRLLSVLHPPFLLGLIAGGAVIYWFTGATTQAVTTGAYRAVEFIKANIKLDGTQKASISDSKRVVEICTIYAQKGMFNIFLAVFFATLAFACFESFLFIGYLISIALFGLYQALFMANAGGAWDNAKKIVEVELKEKGSALHDATVVGDTVGDPFKDTSSVAMNPVIKFTTLFGLLAVELAEAFPEQRLLAAVVLLVLACAYVWRSFYGMRIGGISTKATAH
jgi:K(+)-stimulated pyrophosphate-energized sodium pump